MWLRARHVLHAQLPVAAVPLHLTASVRTCPAGALPQAWFRRGAWRRLLHLNLGANSLQGPLPGCMEGCFAALDELGLHDNM
jgi:hypothetical protein